MNEDSLYVHSIKADIALDKPNGKSVKRKIHEKRTYIAGRGNRDIPNQWLIEGIVVVSKSSGKKYTMKITDPLHKIQGCKWYQSGIKAFHFSTGEKDVKTNDRITYIDYSYTESDDSCDSFALRWKDDEEAHVVDLSN